MADLRVIRRQRKAGLTRQLGKLHRLIVEEDGDAVLEKLTQLRAAFVEFEAAHDTYHDTLDVEGDIDASELWFSEVERGYITEVREAKAWLHGLSAGDAPGKEEFDVSTSSAADVSQSDLINLLSIPKVELDKFNGDPLEYQSFMSIFNETVHNKTGDAQVKLTRLLQYTIGPAKAAIKNCALIGGDKGYQQAREILAVRFGDSHLISQRIVSDLRNGKVVNKSQELQQLADDLLMAQTALEQLGMISEVESQQFILDILGRCPQYVSSRWRSKALEVKRGRGVYPRFCDFVEFISTTATDSSDPVYGYDMVKVQKKIVGRGMCHNTVNVERVDEHGIVSRGQQQQMFPCVVCRVQHRLFQCDRFKAMSPQERLDLVVKYRLCFNCLLGGHRAHECRKQSICSVPGCGRKHTRFVHVERPESGRPRPRETSDTGLASVVSHANFNEDMRVYLPIVPVVVNGRCTVYALLDSGSTNTFVSRDLDRRLNLSGTSRPMSYKMKTLSSDSTISSKLVSLEITAVDNTETMRLSNVLIVPRIAAKYPATNLDLSRYPHLAGTPIGRVTQDAAVDILIGMDNARVLMPLNVRCSKDKGQPYAVRTPFGWSLNGPVPGHELSKDVCVNFVELEQINDDLSNLWNLERSAGDETPTWSREDHKVIDLWEKEIAYKDGHYHLPIPWKDGTPHLPNNRRTVVARLNGILKKLKNTDQYDVYEKNLLSMVDKGYAEEVPEDELRVSDGSVWYLPHHAVVSSSKPGKLRIVFDCAAKHSGVSLNNSCFQGPDLINKLLCVILRFRQFSIALTADVEAMYHQVKIPNKDRNCLRFLWLRDGDVKEYRMTSHLFGGVWCAASSTFALRRSVKDFPCSKLVKETIEEAFYVDDMLKSLETLEDGMEVLTGTKSVLGKAGFNLTKFVSSEASLIKVVSDQDRATEVKDISTDVHSRALGIKWNVSRDVFYYVSKLSLDSVANVTKRTMLGRVSSMYDPLGLISPVVLQGKILFQEAVRLRLDWDDPVPPDLASKWRAWLLSLEHLPELEFPRCIIPNEYGDGALEVHHFADASMAGYGACSYLRAVNKKGEIHVTLLMAKARLTPLKPTTIPRLELCAAATAIELDQIIRREVGVQLLASTFWSDSQITLSYIKSETKRFKVFVANRVGFIRKNSGPEQWNYVPGKSNPADVVSRGCLVKELPSSWKVGPEMLSSYKCTWPTTGPEVCVPDGDIEVRSCLAVVHPPPPVAMGVISRHPVDQLIDYHSSFYKLKKAVAWMIRVRRRLQKVTTCVALEPLSVVEMARAETLSIRHVQAEAFPTELKALGRGQVVGKSSNIRDLSPSMYGGVVVVSSRIKHAAVADNMKRPVILLAKHKLSQMILTEYHNGAHLGTEWTLCQVRGKYWIPRARNLLKKIKGRCVTCRKLYAAPMTQKMADLPPERGEPGKPPFTYVGVDLFGPFFVRIGRAEVKRYGCVYTCFTTRAVHLEVLSSLEADSFINGFIRFMARRGCPKKVWSDNGTNIVGARGEMTRSLQSLQRSKVVEAARRRDVEWTFNPPYASHHGGVWERVIRTIRRVLVAVLGSSPRLTDEILHTTFCEVENIINGRPLTKSSDDVNDETALTPNHLLLMRDNAALPWGMVSRGDLYQKRWRQVQYLASIFWKRWVKEYLPLLHTRQKWHDVEANLKVGELVLVVNENMSRGLWPLGRVLSVVKGRDELVRSARLRTQNNEVVRPITKLVRLEGSL